MTATIQIQHLKSHPAQMCTQVDPEGMDALTLHVYQRGLDHWQPILAAPAGENGDYRIISGHRRRMARLFAFALEDWASEHPEQDVTVEVARTLIATLSEKLGSVEAAADALLNKYGEREIPFVLFSGDQKAEVLALQAGQLRPGRGGHAGHCPQLPPGAGERRVAGRDCPQRRPIGPLRPQSSGADRHSS